MTTATTLTDIADQLAYRTGKDVDGNPARWSGSPLTSDQTTRVFNDAAWLVASEAAVKSPEYCLAMALLRAEYAAENPGDKPSKRDFAEWLSLAPQGDLWAARMGIDIDG